MVMMLLRFKICYKGFVMNHDLRELLNLFSYQIEKTN